MSEGTQIAEQSTGSEIAEASAITASQRLALVREALTNPDVLPEKAAAMMELTFRLEDRQARATFIDAKVRAISEMPHIGKDQVNDHTGNRYSSWEAMQPMVSPILSRHGLVLNFRNGQVDGRVAVTPVLSGHGWEEVGEPVVLPADSSGSKNNVQAVGSSFKYGMRYAAMGMLNLISRGVMEDDDGVAGGGGAVDPYSLLTDEERKVVDGGRAKAQEGKEAYEAWFTTDLDAQWRGFLNFNKGEGGRTWHAQNKELADKIG